MYVTPEQIQATTKANRSMLSPRRPVRAFEKFASLNQRRSRPAFEDSIANARALAGAKDVQDW